MSVDSSGLNYDWLSSLNDSISSDSTLSGGVSGFDYSSLDNSNSAFLDNSGTNMENAAYYAAGNSPGISSYSSGGSGVGGLAGLLAALTGKGAGGSSPLLNSLLGVGSGIYGMSLANQLQSLSKSAITASNPFGPYRAQYAGQLASLEANPSSIFLDPGYQAAFDQGSQAVARRMAGSGYAGSGNEAIALQQYGQSFANNYIGSREAQLAYLAGAGITPNPGPGLSGYGASIDAAGNALGSLGYGASMAAAAAGGGTGHPNAAGGEAAEVASGISNLYDKLTGSSSLSGVSNVAGIYSGLSEGGVRGYGSAAINAGNLAGKTGLYGSESSTASNVLQGAGEALGVYQGIRSGGVVGDTEAAANAGKLATSAGYLGGSTGALGTAVGYSAPILGIYGGIKQGGPLGYGEAALSTYGLAAQAGLVPTISSLVSEGAGSLAAYGSGAAADAAVAGSSAAAAGTGAGAGAGAAAGASAAGALSLAALPVALAAFVPDNPGFSSIEVSGMLNEISQATKAYGKPLDAGYALNPDGTINQAKQQTLNNLYALMGDDSNEFKHAGGTGPIYQQLMAMGYSLGNLHQPITTVAPGGRGWLGGGHTGASRA